MLKLGDTVVCTYGFNPETNKPYTFLYDFHYYTKNGCVVYTKDQTDLKYIRIFSLGQVILATEQDFKNTLWGK